MKSWKHWPYWLRGGVIGGGVALFSLTLVDLCERLVVVPGYSGLGFECYPLAIPWIPFWFVSSLTKLSTMSYEITGVVIWFVFGSFIGFLVRYIKSKKKNIAQ